MSGSMTVKAARLGLGALGVVFALATTSQPSAAQDGAKPAAVAAAPATAAVGDLQAKIAKGKDLFANYGCGSCHSLAAAGAEGHVGPSLDNPGLTEDLVVQRVTNGSGPMPAFGDQLSPEEIQALAAYVAHSRSK